jgi:putative membrane protein
MQPGVRLAKTIPTGLFRKATDRVSDPVPSSEDTDSFASDLKYDREEARALESLSSILTTDDGLRLSGEEMRQARSNWVRDIMSTGRSRVLSKISNRLAVSTIVAASVAAISNWSPENSWWLEIFQVPGWPHELVGGFLAILLVFRTDQAYGRFWEGRTQWSTLGSEIRSLARISVANRHLLEGDIDEVLAHLSAYPAALKQHLRGLYDEDCRDELASIYDAFGKSPETCANVRRILSADNPPLVIMTALSTTLSKVICGNARDAAVAQSVWERSEDSLNSVSMVLSECEKIKCTPLPLSYSRHSSRFFTLFSITLPFSLVRDTTPLLIAPVVLGISWILFATDEIGHVIEEPFGSGLSQEQVGMTLFKDPLSQETFNLFDRDRSGSVDAKEFANAMRKMGIYLSVREAEEIVNRYDENGDKCISNEEWKKAIIDDLAKKSEERKGGMNEGGIAASVGDVIVMGIKGFYATVGMVFGVEMEGYSDGIKQLEVLPLARYCRSPSPSFPLPLPSLPLSLFPLSLSLFPLSSSLSFSLSPFPPPPSPLFTSSHLARTCVSLRLCFLPPSLPAHGPLCHNLRARSHESLPGMCVGVHQLLLSLRHARVLAGERRHRSIQRDILEQILFVAKGSEREHYIAITRKLASISDGELEVIG